MPFFDPVRGKERESAFEKLQNLTTSRFLDVLRRRMRDVNETLDEAGMGPPPLQQYPGKRVPTYLSRWFGPIRLTTTRRGTAQAGDSPFEQLATLVQPSVFIVPNIPLRIPRDFGFEWHGVHAAALLSWKYTVAPGLGAPYNTFGNAEVEPIAHRSYLDSVFGANGGGLWLMNFSGFAFADYNWGTGGGAAKLCWEVDLYDKKRGRSYTDGPAPAEAFTSGAWGMKKIDDRPFLDANTEIEPRLYVRECRMTSALDVSTTIYNRADVAVWLNIVLEGALVREVTNG